MDTQLGIISIKSAAIDTLNGMLLFAILLSGILLIKNIKLFYKVSGTGSKFVPLWTILLCIGYNFSYLTKILIIEIAQFFALWFVIKPILTKIGTYVSKKGRVDVR